MLAAVKVHDRAALDKIFGPVGKELVSGDKVEDRDARETFTARAAEHIRLEKKDEATTILYVGKEDWPFPIPLVKTAKDKWFFDTSAGKEEILARRIGANELETIQVCRAYVQAQREYLAELHDGSDVFQAAQRMASTAGRHDGLYWEAGPSDKESPMGPLFAKAALEGYDLAKDDISKCEGRLTEFHGYFFRILTRQGPAAPGGQYDYLINGHLIGGFGLVAWPARYGSGGIMTFTVNQYGKVYQKDLGTSTRQHVHEMKEYNPDSTWTLVKD
jgi:hypothetical protein